MGFLDSLAVGLRGAGSVLNPEVQRQVSNEYLQRQNIDENRKNFVAQQVIKGIETGAISEEEGRAVLERIGLNVPVGMNPEQKEKIQAVQEQRQIRQAIREIAPNFVKDGKFDPQGMVAAISSKDPLIGAKIAKELGIDMQPKPTIVQEGAAIQQPDGTFVVPAPKKNVTWGPLENGPRGTILQRSSDNQVRQVVGQAPVTVLNGGGITKPPAGYRWAANGELEFIPGGPADPSAKPQKLKTLPTSAIQSYSQNESNLRIAQTALDLVQGKDVKMTMSDGTVVTRKGDKNATGWFSGLMGSTETGDYLLNKMDPSGSSVRAEIADLGSMIIHDRSGAAVTAAEYPRLRPFIPKIGDSPKVVEQKLQRFVSVYKQVQDELKNLYEEQGYTRPGGNAPTNRNVPTPPSGFNIDK